MGDGLEREGGIQASFLQFLKQLIFAPGVEHSVEVTSVRKPKILYINKLSYTYTFIWKCICIYIYIHKLS